jgi:hypothetical protein
MAAFVITSKTTLLGTAWTGTAPGPNVDPTTITGTISSSSNISSFVRGGGEPSFQTAMEETTGQGAYAFRTVIPGITSGDDLVFEANSDTAASQLDAIIRSTLGGVARAGASPIYVDIKRTSAARGATNPSFVAACHISKWAPIMGATGAVASTQLVLTITGSFTELTS